MKIRITSADPQFWYKVGQEFEVQKERKEIHELSGKTILHEYIVMPRYWRNPLTNELDHTGCVGAENAEVIEV